MQYTKYTTFSRKLILAMPLVLFLTTTLLATWALVPLDELVAKSDLIVTGTLHSADQDSHGIGKGYIRVDTIVSGTAMTFEKQPLKIGDDLKIKWADDWACAAGMHLGREGKPGVWLLEVKSDGTVAAAYPGRFAPLEKLDDVRQLAQRTRKKTTSSVDVAVTEKEPGKSVEFYIVDIAPVRDTSPVAAALVLMIATGLYWVMYKSRFRIR